MKFNWGHGIAIFLAIFVLSMVFVVYKSFQQDNPLVEQEYYPKGLEYQKQIQRIANANALPEKIKITDSGSKFDILYPETFMGKKVSGTIYFYRPSDDSGDINEIMKCDSSLSQTIEKARLMEGKYIVKLNWKMEGKEYYQEEVLRVTHK
ncbi:MAG: FixH family protein [Bacteroidales bacterium]|nr:FixH family protein [Bacteroidales bacterium]